MSSRVSITWWEESACLTLVDHPFSDSVTIKIAYGVDILLLLGLIKLSLVH